MFQKILLKDIEIDYQRILGKGFMGSVYVGVHKQSKKKFAVKTIDWNKLPDLEKKFIRREVDNQQKLNHQNIVKLYSTELIDGKLYMVMEYLPYGNLFDKIQSRSLMNIEVIQILKGILEGLEYLHGMNLVHRDIKPENILQGEKGEYKLCDFGFSAEFGMIKGKLHRRQTFCGTQDYFAPEIINGQEHNEKVDIWCIGVLTYEMLHQKAPFDDQKFARQRTVSNTVYLNSQIDEKLKRITRLCLKKDPKERPSARRLLQILNEKHLSAMSTDTGDYFEQMNLSRKIEQKQKDNKLKKNNGNSLNIRLSSTKRTEPEEFQMSPIEKKDTRLKVKIRDLTPRKLMRSFQQKSKKSLQKYPKDFSIFSKKQPQEKSKKNMFEQLLTKHKENKTDMNLPLRKKSSQKINHILHKLESNKRKNQYKPYQQLQNVFPQKTHSIDLSKNQFLNQKQKFSIKSNQKLDLRFQDEYEYQPNEIKTKAQDLIKKLKQNQKERSQEKYINKLEVQKNSMTRKRTAASHSKDRVMRIMLTDKSFQFALKNKQFLIIQLFQFEKLNLPQGDGSG